MKGIYYRIGLIIFLLIGILILQRYLASSPEAYVTYYYSVFLPFQEFRNSLLNKIPFSVGDFIYMLLFLFIVLLLLRFIYFLVTYKRNKQEFWTCVLRLITLPLVLYLFFLLSWGGNYNRPALTADWKTGQKVLSLGQLTELNELLVQRLNALSELELNFPRLKQMNQEAGGDYKEKYCSQLPEFIVKPSAFGYLLGYVGIHGYYNPYTGESQFNHAVPTFMHPFVGLHEMAHQAGIAAEDDANFLAYLACKKSQVPAFQYSGYFNIFLYAFADLKSRDSLQADTIWTTLNIESRENYESLRAMHDRYKSIFRGFSSTLYNRYLRLHGQKKGLRSYNTVTLWVYLLEIARLPEPLDRICPRSMRYSVNL